MNVLIDTSVWVDHFKNHNQILIYLIQMDRVLIHPMILGELACGTPPAPRQQILQDMSQLNLVTEVSLTEIITFIEKNRLYGLGCGLIDMHLLAAAIITPRTKLWTYDKRLNELADRFDVIYHPEH